MNKEIKKFLLAIADSLYPLNFLLRVYIDYKQRKRFKTIGNKDIESIFTNHYLTNEWGEDESVSGPGSTMRYTENLRQELPDLFEKYKIRKILDAPCGDFNWFKLIQRDEGVSYVGGDIVRPLIEKNQLFYGNRNTNFIHIDIINDKLPDADLMICRDCLIHLSENDIKRFLNNFLNSNIKYLLTTNYPNLRRNHNIPTGYFRELNLKIFPYELHDPIFSVKDWIEGFPVRFLSLWEKDQIKKYSLR